MHDPVHGVVERKVDSGERVWLLRAEGLLRRRVLHCPFGRVVPLRAGKGFRLDPTLKPHL
jgi:hypothetical protein